MGGRRAGHDRGGLVWDWPLRAFHWALVLCVAGSWTTHSLGMEWFDWHRRLGYATVVLVVFRFAWGFVGPRHARFASFVRGPRAIVEYVRGRQEAPAAGHNPLGALAVLAMLASLGLQAATGLYANDEIANAGPFYGWVEQATSNRLTRLHRLNSNVLLVLIGVHLLAVAGHEWRGRRLVRPMITGRGPAGEGVTGQRGLLAIALVVAITTALALMIRAAPAAVVGFYGF